jgi:hypothetical protein
MRPGMFGGWHTRPFSGTPADVKLKTAGISKCSTMGKDVRLYWLTCPDMNAPFHKLRSSFSFKEVQSRA